ncbi:MAG: BLUF domain-containing protein [Actinomycetota bacterium]|nr:BLUF domain-containing protein [Actinomycetota bacterium]
MRRLVYASRAVAPFSVEDLLELLQSARTRNEAGGVTGMLVYASGSFLQLIEGDDAPVEVIWDRIRMDPRHTALRVLGDAPARSRLFGEWSMGFHHPDEELLEETLPGYRAGSAYPFVDSRLVNASDSASTLLSLYARRAD